MAFRDHEPQLLVHSWAESTKHDHPTKPVQDISSSPRPGPWLGEQYSAPLATGHGPLRLFRGVPGRLVGDLSREASSRTLSGLYGSSSVETGLDEVL